MSCEIQDIFMNVIHYRLKGDHDRSGIVVLNKIISFMFYHLFP